MDDAAGGEAPPRPDEDVVVSLTVTLHVTVPAADAPTPLAAAQFANSLLDSLPLELGGVPLSFKKHFKF